MDRPYVEWARVESYRCIRSVDLDRGTSLSMLENAEISRVLSPALLRLNPDDLRELVEPFTTGQPLWFRNEHGRGLPALYHALLSRDLPAFFAIAKRFTKIYALGERWLSYADGDLERELVTTDSSIPKAG